MDLKSAKNRCILKPQKRRQYTMAKESQKRATRKYDAENTVQFKMKLNKGTDADILQKLSEVPNKQGYIKELIRSDIGK